MDNNLTYTDQLCLDCSLQLYQQAVQLIPGGTETISKRPVHYALGSYPVYIDRAQGAYVWDVDGNKYIDYVLACGPIVLGYQYPAVDEAIRRQLARGIIFGQLSPLEVQAAQAIVDVVPCAEMVRFFKGGAESNAAAVRIARAVTGRAKVASCGYRGWHDQWAITSERTREGVPAILQDYTLSFQYGDLVSLRMLFEKNPGQIAAVILEPATVDAVDAEFVRAVRDLTHAQGALLIFDEVVTGFRLALGGAQSYLDVIPDMAVFAKALANGMPLAAVAGSRTVMQVAERLFITLTYGDEALSLAAAIASLQVMREEDVHSHLWKAGERLMRGLTDAAHRSGLPFESKGVAPMWRFVPNDEALRRWGLTSGQVWSYLLREMARRGVLWRPGGIHLISYSHTEEDVDYTIRIAGEVFDSLKEVLEGEDPQTKLASPLGAQPYWQR